MSCCSDCIHYGVCHLEIICSLGIDYLTGEIYNDMEKRCPDFKDEELVVDLPCKIGDKVYFPLTSSMYNSSFDLLKFNAVNVGKVKSFLVTKKKANIRVGFMTNGYTELTFYNDEFDKKIFFIKSRAELKLKELNNEQ